MVTVVLPFGENKMKLREIITQLDNFDGNDTIYVKQPWTPDSEAIVATEPDNGGVPNEAVKIDEEYFLEVFIAQEFLEGWLSNVNEEPSNGDRCLRLITYVENDA